LPAPDRFDRPVVEAIDRLMIAPVPRKGLKREHGEGFGPKPGLSLQL
jgi:hypothetical protein